VDGAVARIAQLLKLPEHLISESLSVLTRLRVLRITPSGYVLEQNNLYLKDAGKLSAVHSAFLYSQLKQSLSALEKSYSKRGKFYSQTFTGSMAKYATYIAELERSLDQILRDSDEDQNEELFQVNFQFFPLSDLS
jgi:hypothetical protein